MIGKALKLGMRYSATVFSDTSYKVYKRLCSVKTDLVGVRKTTRAASRRPCKLGKQQHKMLWLGAFGVGVAIALNLLKINLARPGLSNLFNNMRNYYKIQTSSQGAKIEMNTSLVRTTVRFVTFIIQVILILNCLEICKRAIFLDFIKNHEQLSEEPLRELQPLLRIHN